MRILKVAIANNNDSIFQQTMAQPNHSMISPKQLGFEIYLNKNLSIFEYFLTGFFPVAFSSYFASLMLFSLASCNIESECILIIIQITKITVPNATLLGLAVIKLLILATPCKQPLAKVKLKAPKAIQKGTLVYVLSDKGQMISLFMQWMIKRVNPKDIGQPFIRMKYAAHRRLGISNKNHAILAFRQKLMGEFDNLPQFIFMPVRVSQPNIVQPRTMATHVLYSTQLLPSISAMIVYETVIQ